MHGGEGLFKSRRRKYKNTFKNFNKPKRYYTETLITSQQLNYKYNTSVLETCGIGLEIDIRNFKLLYPLQMMRLCNGIKVIC